MNPRAAWGPPFLFLGHRDLSSMSALMNTYSRLPVSFTRGEGPLLFDAQGREYLDALSGIAVTNLGHAHPRVTAAITEQARRLLHCSNLYAIELQERVGEMLVQKAGMDRVFFSNSGAEANEAAIKLARLHAHQRGIEKPQIVVLEGAFHGRTLATLSATGSRKIQAGFEPLVGGFLRAPRERMGELARHVQDNCWSVAPLMVELVASWIADGTAAQIVAERRAEATRRLELAHRVLGGWSFTAHPHGFHLWLALPDPWTAESFVDAAGEAGVRIAPTGAFVAAGAIPQRVRLALGREASAERLDLALGRVAALLERS